MMLLTGGISFKVNCVADKLVKKKKNTEFLFFFLFKNDKLWSFFCFFLF